MAEGGGSQKVDPNLVAEIVSSYVGKNSVAIDQLGGLIATVHHTLSVLGTDVAAPAFAEEKLSPAVPIRRSVQRDHVVCLECGFHAKTLRRHLRVAHGLDPAAYRSRWNLPVNHPLTAPSYSAQRSAMAKQLGLGRSPAAVSPPPALTGTRRGRPRRPAAG
jgi:predicted transcriptional regulator